MTFPDGINFSATNANNLLFQTSLRRDIKAVRFEVQRLKKDDATSKGIELWVTNFFDALSRENVDAGLISDQYFTRLQKILVDDFSESPLDDNPLLGSDGYTYGTKHLSITLYKKVKEKQDAKYRHRSPFNPESEIDFTVDSHPLAKYMVEWLQIHENRLSYDDVEREYKTFSEAEMRHILPTKKNDRILNILEIQRKRDEELLRNQQLNRDLFEENRRNLDDVVNGLEEDLNNYGNAINRKMDEVEEQTQAVLKGLQNELDEIEILVQQKTEEINHLKKKLNSLDEQIKAAEKNDHEIKIRLLELDQAIEDNKKKKRRQLMQAVAIAAVCAVATWGMSTCISANSSVNFVVTPYKSAGARAIVTYTP